MLLSRCVLALSVLAPALADASPIAVISSARSIVRSVDEIAFPGEPASNGGLPAQTDSTTSTGDFLSDLSATYTAGDGVFLDIADVQQSSVSDAAILFSTTALVVAQDPPGGASANDLFADAVSHLDVSFEVTSPAHFVLDWNDRSSCDDRNCTTLMLEDLGLSTIVFDVKGSQNPGGDDVGSYQGDLAPGSYRFVAAVDGHWFVRERSFPGGALDASITFASVPEPAAALLLGVCGAMLLAARARQAPSCSGTTRSSACSGSAPRRRRARPPGARRGRRRDADRRSLRRAGRERRAADPRGRRARDERAVHRSGVSGSLRVSRPRAPAGATRRTTSP